MQRAVSVFRIAKSLLRVPTYLLLLLYLAIGFLTGLMVEGQIPSLNLAFLQTCISLVGCGLLIALWYIGGSGLNDYADYEIDLINLKGDRERPLVVGATTRPVLLRVALGCMALALLIAAAISWQQLVLTLALAALSASYSIKPFQISRRGGLAPLLLPLGYIVLPFYSGFMLSSHNYSNATALLLAGAYYIHFIGRIILKDYRDVKGDKANGKITFLLRHGNTAVCIVSGVTVVVSSTMIVMALWSYMTVFRYAIVFFVFFSLTTLLELSRTTTWQQQKPLLASFGRSMTGISTVTIVTLLSAVWNTDRTTQLVLAAAIVLVYAWSSRQAFLYNQTQTRVGRTTK